MAIEAPLSKHKKNNLKIYMAICIVAAIWFGYDGYVNKKFIEKNTEANGKPNSVLAFNQKAPPLFIAGTVLLGLYLYAIRNRKIIADETELIITTNEKIRYDSIEKIDKTYFDKKGFFTITYKEENGKQVDRRLSDRKYDNLAALLDHLVAKIS
jgi:hypothetical protein